MLTVIVFIIIILFCLTMLFASPRLSPIPYFPTNAKDLSLIIKAFALKNNSVVVDLGAGDGGVLFAAARYAFERHLIARFIAIEINPVLIVILHLRRFLHPNRKNITIIWKDMFAMDFSHLSSIIYHPLFYLYISPWLLEKIHERIKTNFTRYTIVSYMYPIQKMKLSKEFSGKNRILIYKA